MSAKFDSEDLLDLVLEIMTTNGALNTKIAAIEAEKLAKSKELTPTLAQVDSNAYHVQTWDDKILQYSPAIFYGIQDIQTQDGGGGVVAKSHKVFVEVVYTHNGQTNDAHKRICRYVRAIEEIFEASFAPALGMGKVKIEQAIPLSWQSENDSSEEIKTGGIIITITLV